MNTMQDLNSMQRQQISLLQQSIWDLQKAQEKIQSAIGASNIGKIYVEQLKDLVMSLEDSITNIHE